MSTRRRASAPRTAAPDVAPVHVPEDDDRGPVRAVDVPEPAPIYPTAAHVAEIREHVLANDPALKGASDRRVMRAVREAIPEHAARFATSAKRQHTLSALAAPVFPTEQHAAELRAAIPDITTAETKAVLSAGHAAFVASVAAGEPTTTAEVPA